MLQFKKCGNPFKIVRHLQKAQSDLLSAVAEEAFSSSDRPHICQLPNIKATIERKTLQVNA